MHLLFLHRQRVPQKLPVRVSAVPFVPVIQQEERTFRRPAVAEDDLLADDVIEDFLAERRGALRLEVFVGPLIGLHEIGCPAYGAAAALLLHLLIHLIRDPFELRILVFRRKTLENGNEVMRHRIPVGITEIGYRARRSKQAFEVLRIVAKNRPVEDILTTGYVRIGQHRPQPDGTVQTRILYLPFAEIVGGNDFRHLKPSARARMVRQREMAVV